MTEDIPLKKYGKLGNIRFYLRGISSYIPALVIWCCLAILLRVAVPLAEMLLPREALRLLETGGDITRLVATVGGITLGIAIMSAVMRFTDKYIYQYKLLLGTYMMRLISRKGLTTDYENLESDRFRSLLNESYQACRGNESDLRNVCVVLVELLSSVLGFIVYGALLVSLNWLVVLFLTASSLAGYYIGKRANRWIDEHRAEKAEYNKRLSYIDRAAEDPRGAKDIRLYRIDRWLKASYIENVERIVKWYGRYGRVVIKTAFFSATISLAREGVAYAYLIWLAVRGDIGVGDFVMYFAAITGFSNWLNDIMSRLTSLDRVSRSISVLRSCLDYPERFKREGGIRPSGESPKEIRLENVCYRYKGAESDTLSNINITIKPGEHIGIVGLNGAGKTTLVKLISGLCDPTGGRVLYDGRDVREYDRSLYTALFSAVFQQYSILPLTFREIIAEDSPADDKRIKRCLETAGLREKIDALPKRLDTYYDSSINQGGVMLSGGETQKLLLARAIYRQSPNLILDEPTAALDPISENELYEVYSSVTTDRTGLFISHRLASTRFCSRIILIKDGRVIEEGTHESLLSAGGEYRRLFDTQARYYRSSPDEEAQAHEE